MPPRLLAFPFGLGCAATGVILMVRPAESPSVLVLPGASAPSGDVVGVATLAPAADPTRP